MDSLTHLLIGYVLGTTLFDGSPALVALATFMAFFPDLDTLSWVLPGPFRRLRHRGATHSLVVGASASAALAVPVALLANVPWPSALFAALIGFISHVALDVLNWGCLLLWPWKRHGVEFTVQAGLAGPFVASALGFAAIAIASRFDAHDATALAVGLAWFAYLVAKVLLKALLLARHAPRVVAWPTASPLAWRVVETRVADGERVTRYFDSRFAPLLAERVVLSSRHRVARPRLPLKTPEDAAAFTFSTPEVRALDERGFSLAVDVSQENEGAWLARWFVLDTHWGRECLGALVRVQASGEHAAERARFALPSVAEVAR